MSGTYRANYYAENRDRFRVYGETRRRAHPLLSVHTGMMKRCGHRKGARPDQLRKYAERGIRVCEAWRHFRAFEEWAIANGWRKGLTIDRIDGSKGYEPGNCRFVTVTQNNRNRNCTAFVVYKGKRMPLAEAYDRSGSKLKYGTVFSRHQRGLSIEDCLKPGLLKPGPKRR